MKKIVPVENKPANLSKGIMMNAKTLEADVLCVGGGIAGLMAAIRARELGAKVVLADKANTVRSGSAGTGCDHFRASRVRIGFRF